METETVNVLFFEPFAIFSPHFETCLEIIQEHGDQGASITYIGCDASVPICYANPEHHLSLCLRCISRRNQGLKRLNVSKPIHYISLDDLPYPIFENLEKDEWRFGSIDELSKYKIDQYDIGLAVLSSLISINRTPAPDLTLLKDQMIKLLRASFRTYHAIKKYLSENRVNKVFIFNGRFCFLRGVFRICQHYNIDCYIHERGANIHKFALFKNVLPHNIDYMVKAIRESWDHAQVEKKVPIAEKYYHARASGKQQSWFSFVANQEKGCLPRCWDPMKMNLAIFNSSEDEFAAIGDEWKNPLYSSQLDGIRRIVSDLSKHEGVHVYMRMHPNLSGVNNNSVNALHNITSDNFTLIPPESKVSTYELIRCVNKVITFGSSVGIEATFWGKPSILAGNCFYRSLGSVYIPESHEDLIKMSLADLQPKDRTGALMYGYYLQTFGVDFKYFKAEGLFSGTYMGKQIKPTIAVRILTNLHSPSLFNPIYQLLTSLAKHRVL